MSELGTVDREGERRWNEERLPHPNLAGTRIGPRIPALRGVGAGCQLHAGDLAPNRLVYLRRHRETFETNLCTRDTSRLRARDTLDRPRGREDGGVS
jgi:hypothetical protein